MQEWIQMTGVCDDCPIDQYCCYSPFIALLPEEQARLNREHIIVYSDWCPSFNRTAHRCNLGDERPQVCKQAVCRWIDEKLPIEKRVPL